MLGPVEFVGDGAGDESETTLDAIDTDGGNEEIGKADDGPFKDGGGPANDGGTLVTPGNGGELGATDGAPSSIDELIGAIVGTLVIVGESV